MLNLLKTLVLFVILLSIIVSIHELGHLIAAKIFKVYCKEYSLGMGPVLYKKQFKETQFSIRAFPIGGFVAMAGDNENDLETSVDTTDIPFERTLPGIAKWKRIIIMLAGIFMNFVLAWIVYSLIICAGGVYKSDTKPVISEIYEEYPAYNSGLEVNDVISKIEFENGASLSPKTYSEISVFVLSEYDGVGAWLVTVDRDGKLLEFEITPTYNQEEERYVIGIVFDDLAADYVKVNIFNCWYYALDYIGLIVRILFNTLLSLFKGIGLDSLSGPIGIVQTVDQVNVYGYMYYFELIGLISLNVGMFNAIPLPIFDGGRVFLTLIEIIIGRPINKKVEETIMKICTFILLGLFIYVSFMDVTRLIGG